MMETLVQSLNNYEEILKEDGYSVRMLHEFGIRKEYMTPAKIGELWNEFKKHDVLFMDEIKGDPEAFIDIMLNPRSMWMEIFSLEKDKPIGIASLNKIIPGFDAEGHFSFWDGKGSGRENLSLLILKWVFTRYKLRRITGMIPLNQKGTLRFIKRLGFQEEGVKREGTLRHGRWIDLAIFGLLHSELEEALNG
ncbi:MAG: GNAT family protein [Nitrosopumilus sp.]